LNEEDVEKCFVEDLMVTMPEHEKLKLFMDYLTENYIDAEAKFPIPVWADMTSSPERTINAYENFHSKFNSLYYTPHPDIYVFLGILKKILIDTKIAIRTATQITKKPKITTNKKFAFIEENIVKFKAGQLSRFDFVKHEWHLNISQLGNKKIDL